MISNIIQTKIFMMKKLFLFSMLCLMIAFGFGHFPSRKASKPDPSVPAFPGTLWR